MFCTAAHSVFTYRAEANETCSVENATHVLCEFSTEVVICK